jgi:hypothetical protein
MDCVNKTAIAAPAAPYFGIKTILTLKLIRIPNISCFYRESEYNPSNILFYQFSPILSNNRCPNIREYPRRIGAIALIAIESINHSAFII